MAIETEVKVRLESAEAISRRLEALGARSLTPRHFEDNIILDFPDGRLRTARALLRVRTTDRGSWITFKGAPRPEGAFKVREELETGVAEGAGVSQILERIGLVPWFRYQKYRREFEVRHSAAAAAVLHVTVDETPIGAYAEFEGCEEAIRATAAAMGIGEHEFLRDSYYALYVEHCRRHDVAPGPMVFEQAP